MPVIHATMTYPVIYLETFTDAINFNYEAKCQVLYEKNKGKLALPRQR